MKYLVLDISNLLYRTFYADKSEDDITLAGLAQHQALLTLNKYYREQKPDKLVMAFDRKAWRIDYTKSEACLSGKIYKGNRRKNLTPKEREKYKLFLGHLNDFEDLMRDYTSVICLAGDGLEADDLVAGFVQQYASPENEIIMVSMDKDYIQMLKHINTKLINPADGKERTLDDWEGSAELFMFEKCIRGDPGDNVQSAYPRVRRTRILKAWVDPLERVNMMEEKWTNHEGKEMKVKEVYAENELLMDLTKQPQKWRDKMTKIITENVENPGKYNFFEFMKFLGRFEMKRVADNADAFAKMLSR